MTMKTTIRRAWGSAALLALTFGMAACSGATDVERLEITATGAVVGQAYLDLNGNGMLGAADQPVAAVTVRLSAAAGEAIVAEVTTNAEGVFLFEDVPVGRYRVSLTPGLLADSLVPVEGPEPFDVLLDETAEVVVGATYPALTLEEVRDAEPGRRVFTTGIALNARQSFSDGRVFLKGANTYLQAMEVARSTPAVSVGDSVRFLGTTTRTAGQPALTSVTPYILVQQAQLPIPVEVATGTAAEADGGDLDGALVVIRSGVVSDTVTVGGDFTFQADDGSGPVEVVLRAFLGFAARPGTGTAVSARGMLAPFDDGSGVVRWRVLVRAPSELGVTPAP